MTLQWYEETGSRTASVKRPGTRDETTCEVRFRCIGTTDDAVVHQQAYLFFGANRTYNIEGQTLLVMSYDVTHLGADAWEVTAHYESMGMDEDGGGGGGGAPDAMKRSRSFDTGGATTHISCGFSERAYGNNPPDQQCAINADGEDVKGIDIVIPSFQWQEQYDIPSSLVTPAYMRTLADLTGCVNAEPFRSFAAGEVLFAGCSGTQQWDSEKGDGPWGLSYKFVASVNVNNLTIGGINGITKGGHEYLWVKFEDAVEGNALLRKPKAVYVNAVYHLASFSGLGLGQ
jgi:hypothetical protein